MRLKALWLYATDKTCDVSRTVMWNLRFSLTLECPVCQEKTGFDRVDHVTSPWESAQAHANWLAEHWLNGPKTCPHCGTMDKLPPLDVKELADQIENQLDLEELKEEFELRYFPGEKADEWYSKSSDRSSFVYSWRMPNGSWCYQNESGSIVQSSPPITRPPS